MAKANFVKKAQKNIYINGKRREYVSETGKSKGQTKSVIDKTIPADKNDKILIAKGESYYWWQFKNSPKQFSKERPKNSQLTQSNFLSQLYALEEKIEEFSCDNREDFESFRDEVKEEIEQLRDECQESLDNMPEGLQQGSTGELLQERIDAMDSWASEIENIECDYDEDDLRKEVLEENDMDEDDVKDEEEEDGDENDEEEDDDDNDEDEKLSEDEIQEQINEKIQEKVDEAIEELQNASHGL